MTACVCVCVRGAQRRRSAGRWGIMGGEEMAGWLGWPQKAKSCVQGGMHHLWLFVFISRWPLLVRCSSRRRRAPIPPADYSYSLCLASCHDRRRSRPGKKGHGLNTNKCPLPHIPTTTAQVGNAQAHQLALCVITMCACACVPFVVSCVDVCRDRTDCGLFLPSDLP